MPLLNNKNIHHAGLAIHYGWWIVVSAMFSVFVSLGVGRFALGMLLPAMGQDLQLSYEKMGWISTSNFAGYLLGAIWVYQLQKRYGERLLIFVSLMTVTASIAGISTASNFAPLVILYAATGLGSGIAFVCAINLVAHWFSTERRGQASGFLSVGAGLAIMLAGWAIPLINHNASSEGWRLGWASLACICLPISIFCLIVIRNRPANLRLFPFGSKFEPIDKKKRVRSETTTSLDANVKYLIMRLAGIYFLFGATYVVYGTFVVTTLVDEHGMSEAKAGQFWIWLGFFGVFCGAILGTFSDKFGRRRGIMTALLMQGIAHSLMAYGNGDAIIYISITVFGLSFFGVPLIITAATADYLTPDRALRAIGIITVACGLGQIIGPILAALVAEHTGSFTKAYLASAILVATAIVLTLSLPSPRDRGH